MAFTEKLSFNPLVDSIPLPDGNLFKFEPPATTELPSMGFDRGNAEFYPDPRPQPRSDIAINISPESQRLQVLEPFQSPFPDACSVDPIEMPSLTVLMRVRGKCTTDHISAAGPWLKYKGHLSNISQNLCECLNCLSRLIAVSNRMLVITVRRRYLPSIENLINVGKQ